ncbi:hypothetical protein N9383_00045 [Granulosicoccus sp.]|nr:hypothetical protein [Granulosicoccus sp.]
MFDNKIQFFFECQRRSLPTPTIVAILGNVSGDSNDIPHPSSEEQLGEVLYRCGAGAYVIKPFKGIHGSDIMRIKISDKGLFSDTDRALIAGLIKQDFKGGNTYVVQKCLQPHKDLRVIMPAEGLGTVRMVTVRDGQTAKLFAACVKIPTGSNFVDNFQGGASGNLLVAVDLKSHRLKTPFGSDENELVIPVTNHPDSGMTLEGLEFPRWQDMVNTVLAAADAFDEFHSVGWDVALCHDGPCLIEANWNWACNILQVALDRGLKRELSETLTL